MSANARWFVIREDQWGDVHLVVAADGQVWIEHVDRKDGGGGRECLGSWQAFAARHAGSTEPAYRAAIDYIVGLAASSTGADDGR
jgi:hypothetical protein